jgi:hypothetical protein
MNHSNVFRNFVIEENILGRLHSNSVLEINIHKDIFWHGDSVDSFKLLKKAMNQMKITLSFRPYQDEYYLQSNYMVVCYTGKFLLVYMGNDINCYDMKTLEFRKLRRLSCHLSNMIHLSKENVAITYKNYVTIFNPDSEFFNNTITTKECVECICYANRCLYIGLNLGTIEIWDVSEGNLSHVRTIEHCFIDENGSEILEDGQPGRDEVSIKNIVVNGELVIYYDSCNSSIHICNAETTEFLSNGLSYVDVNTRSTSGTPIELLPNNRFALIEYSERDDGIYRDVQIYTYSVDGTSIDKTIYIPFTEYISLQYISGFLYVIKSYSEDFRSTTILRINPDTGDIIDENPVIFSDEVMKSHPSVKKILPEEKLMISFGLNTSEDEIILFSPLNH